MSSPPSIVDAAKALQNLPLAEAGIHISHADFKGVFTQFFDVTSVSMAIGKRLDDLFLADKQTKLQQLAEAAISSGKVQKARLKLRLFNQNKSPQIASWFEVSIFPRRQSQSSSEVIGVTAIFIDLGSENESAELEAQLRLRIAELEQLNCALVFAKDSAQSAQITAENAERAKSDFLAMMSQ